MQHFVHLPSASLTDARRQEREAMMRDLADELRDTAQLTGCAGLSSRVLQAMSGVPREAFLPADLQASSYLNMALPIGHGQTISQPYIVALMTELLGLSPTDVVLEIGTGSGYQAAILSRMSKQVYSVELIAALAHQATDRLARLNFRNVNVGTGDGHAGWLEHAPYDAILVAAAASRIPQALTDQLKPGGRLVIPVSTDHWRQDLILINKDPSGQLRQRLVLPVAFVPLR
jgi:protein-L-isoaspartate(D-aspartate) O-methyltransferase